MKSATAVKFITKKKQEAVHNVEITVTKYKQLPS